MVVYRFATMCFFHLQAEAAQPEDSFATWTSEHDVVWIAEGENLPKNQ